MHILRKVKKDHFQGHRRPNTIQINLIKAALFYLLGPELPEVSRQPHFVLQTPEF